MELLKRLSLISLVTAALATPSLAATPMVVGQTYNTGFNSLTNAPLAPGSSDLYFNLYSYAGNTPVVAHPDFPAWVQTASAQWIAPVENESGAPGSGAPAGVYDYNSFLATDFLVPTSVTVTGSFAADDGSTFYVNGTFAASISPEASLALTPFSYTFTLGAGPSMVPIDFFVNNLNTGGSQSTNPTGLLVTNLKFTASGSAPEPSTWALLLAGGCAVLLVRRARGVNVS